MVKTVTSTLPAVPQPNDIISFLITVENTGNVTLDAPTLSDTLSPIGGTAITPNPVPVLTAATDTNANNQIDVGETWEYTLDYAITQNDIDAGGVVNLAEVETQDPSGATVLGDDDVQADLTQDPMMNITKTAPLIAPLDFVAGLLVEYSYVVENVGNVTIVDPVFVEDDKFVDPIACGTGDLTVSAPGNERTCTATYEVTAADVLNGFVTNQAVATDGVTRSNTGSATIPQAGSPAITLEKVADTADFTAAADRIDYTFTVRNTGR